MADRQYIFNKKNVIVTGGAGFLGSHLCDQLVKNSKVICIDNYISSNQDNIHHLFQNPDFEFIKHDISKPLVLSALPELKKFDVEFQGVQEVYYLATPTAPGDYLQHPIETLISAAEGTRIALEWARAYNASFLYASSASVYGAPPFPEKPYVSEAYWGFVDPVGPLSSFTEGKRYGEALVHHYREVYGMDAKIARIFSTYGPRMRYADTRTIPSVIRQALEGKDITVYGTPEQSMSACYATDAVDALMKIMASKSVALANVGNSQKWKLNDVIDMVKKITKSKSLVKYQEPRAVDVVESLPDVRMMRDTIGWLPLISLETGLTKTVEHMKALQTVHFSEEVSI